MAADENLFSSYILKFFREFYVLLLECRLEALQEPSVLKYAGGNKGTPISQVESKKGEEISSKLFTLLKNQEQQAYQTEGSFGMNMYKEAQYMMASFADETMLTLQSWSGHRFWELNLLENRIFKTHVGGEKIFDIVETFLKERDPMRRPLAVLYLMCLGLGFRGRYRGVDDAEQLQKYRADLFFFIYQKKPDAILRQPQFFPDALSQQLQAPHEQTSLVSQKRRWISFLIGTWIIFFISSYVLWHYHTRDLKINVDALLNYVVLK